MTVIIKLYIIKIFYCLIKKRIKVKYKMIKVKYIYVSPIFIYKQDVGLKRTLESNQKDASWSFRPAENKSLVKKNTQTNKNSWLI